MNEQPAEWDPSIPDEYTGNGGSYIYDPATGTRTPAPPEPEA